MKLAAIIVTAFALGAVGGYVAHRPATHVVTKTVKVESSSRMTAVRFSRLHEPR